MGFLSAIGGFIGGGIDSERDRKNAQDAAYEQQKFQERMSNTAHQREVKDLRAAGLNPILSATGGQGASSPAGSLAPMPKSQIASSALDALRVEKEIKEANAAIKLADQQAKAAGAAAMKDLNSAKNVDVQTEVLASQIQAIKKEAGVRESEADWAKKLMKYDQLTKRLQSGLNSVSTAKDLLNPLKTNPGTMTRERKQYNDALDKLDNSLK